MPAGGEAGWQVCVREFWFNMSLMFPPVPGGGGGGGTWKEPGSGLAEWQIWAN